MATPLWQIETDKVTWHHFDMGAAGLYDWITAQADGDVADALLAPETRPPASRAMPTG